MRIILCIRDLLASTGGPPRSVCGLADGLVQRGHSVSILAGHWDGHPKGTVYPASDKIDICWFKMHRIPGLNGAFSPDVLERFLELKPDCQTIVHDNGPWFLFSHSIARVAEKNSIPLVFSPRGNLTEWAFRYRGWKKRLCWSLYVKRDVNSAAVVHATSEREMTDLWKIGVSRPVALVSNAADLPLEDACANHDVAKSHRRALFLSRIHAKKGLLMLLEAWHQVRPMNWRLSIAGIDEDGYWGVVKQKIINLGLDKDVDYIGSVYGEDRQNVYKSADLFVFPSYTENYGLVIAEALASCLPVITTTGTPWREIKELNCGWWIEPTVGAVTEALRAAVELSPGERRAMGDRGRKLIAENHSWDSASERMEQVYKWVLNKGACPDFVFPAPI